MQRAKKNILIVEDDQSIRETVQAVLELEGYEVVTAENGRDGFRVLRQKGHPDLILLDLMMPEMDGWEFIKEFRSDPDYTPIPVIILTASGLTVKPEGATALFSKPMDLDGLVHIARQYCGQFVCA